MTTIINYDMVAEAVFCYNHSTDEMYDKDLHTAHRYECCLFSMLGDMTDEEKKLYQREIGVCEG